jgi:hypothetical protein
LCGWVVVGGVKGNFSVSFGPKPRFRLLIWFWTNLNNYGTVSDIGDKNSEESDLKLVEILYLIRFFTEYVSKQIM